VDFLSEDLPATCGDIGSFRASSSFGVINIYPGLSHSTILYAKEFLLLAHVLSDAKCGEPASACDAIESFGKDTLSVEGRWLKIAGDTKTEILKVGVSRPAGEGCILEIGTYWGYSALRMALAKPGARIVSLEVDPAHLVIARNGVAFAGMSHSIDTWTGHSKDLLPRLSETYLEDLETIFCTLFLDERGSGFGEDLHTIEGLGLLAPDAAVIADNVLKPGAPSFLWLLCKSGAYTTQIISLQEFAMDSEDWMSVSVNRKCQAVDVPAHPSEVFQMQWESDRIRALATGQGVIYEQWSAHAEHMRRIFARLSVYAAMQGDDLSPLDLCLVTLHRQPRNA